MSQPLNALPSLSSEQLAELLPLVDSADSVELKLTVNDAHRRSAVAALDLDPLDAQIRQVAFFDTPDLTLYEHGVVVRLRRVQGKPADGTVKLRPVVPDELPANFRKSPNLGVEVDTMPGGFVCSAAMKSEQDSARVREVFSGARRLEKQLSKEQRNFYRAYAPEGLSLDSLSLLGPINVVKLKATPAGFDRRMVAELWTYPDGSRILELSTKCLPQEAFDVAARGRAFLAERGIDLTGAQHTKTRTALEFFAGELQASEAR